MLETVLSEDKKILFFKNSIPEKSGIFTRIEGNCDYCSPKEDVAKLANQKIKAFEEKENIKYSLRITPPNRDIVAFVSSENKTSEKISCDSIICDINKNGERIMLMAPSNNYPIIIISGISCLALIHASRRSVQLNIIKKTLNLIEKKCLNREDVHRLRFLVWPGICKKFRNINPQFKSIFPKYMDETCFDLMQMIIDKFSSSYISENHINIVPNCPCHSTHDGQSLFYSFQREEKEKNLIFIIA